MIERDSDCTSAIASAPVGLSSCSASTSGVADMVSVSVYFLLVNQRGLTSVGARRVILDVGTGGGVPGIAAVSPNFLIDAVVDHERDIPVRIGLLGDAPLVVHLVRGDQVQATAISVMSPFPRLRAEGPLERQLCEFSKNKLRRLRRRLDFARRKLAFHVKTPCHPFT